MHCGSQVPPDLYIPDYDEDEQNPDERIDRKWKNKSSASVAHVYTNTSLLDIHTIVFLNCMEPF